MKAGFLQYNPIRLDVARNLRTVEQMITGESADLIVLPELFATGYCFESAAEAKGVSESLEDRDAPTLTALRAWAARLDATIVAGYAELVSGELYNSAVVVDRRGIVGNYRKVHLYYKEKTIFLPGSGFGVFDLADRSGATYRLGVMICFDWYYPEAARSLALLGADVIAHPSNLVRKDCPRSMPIRALENHVYTITASRTGTENLGGESVTFIGKSHACNPDGEVIASADADESCFRVFEIDPVSARDRQITPLNDLLRDRQSDAYYAIALQDPQLPSRIPSKHSAKPSRQSKRGST